MTDESYEKLFHKAIPSRAVREQCKKFGRVFSLAELATLVHNNPLLLHTERLDALELIGKELRADGEEAVSAQIERCLHREMAMEKELFNTYSDAEFYEIFFASGDDGEEERLSPFSTMADAFRAMEAAHGGNVKAPCRIEKRYIGNPQNYVVGVFRDAPRDTPQLVSLASPLFDQPFAEWKRSFEGAYVSVPHPFRSGDLVAVIGGAAHDVGVFASCIDDADWERQEARLCGMGAGGADATDIAGTRVEFLGDDGRFTHDHPDARFLEYAGLPDGDPRKPALEVAAELLRGKNCSIEVLQLRCDEYARTRRYL